MQSDLPTPGGPSLLKTFTKRDQQKPLQAGLREGESQNEATLRGINSPEKGEEAPPEELWASGGADNTHGCNDEDGGQRQACRHRSSSLSSRGRGHS